MKNDTDSAVRAAVITSLAMIGVQVAAKATNDSLFLSNFPITSLPTMLMISSVLSIVFVLATSRAMAVFGPSRLVPSSFFASSLILLCVWGLMFVSPKASAVVLFIHISALGSILISGFWSMVNERFDPHTAKKKIGHIAMGAAIGGVVGGLVAGAVATSLTLSVMLPILAVVHMFCGWQVRGLRSVQPPVERQKEELKGRSGLQVLAQVSYVRNLGLFVLLISITAVILEYVFKAHAVDRFATADRLMQFFSGYYLTVGVISLVIQSAFNKLSLEKLGLANTVAILPYATIAGGAGALLLPGIASSGLATLSDTVLQNSLFRAAYELFYVPVPAGDKRAAKTIIDVGIRRLADTAGGGLTKAVLFSFPQSALSILLGIAVVVSVLELLVVICLRKGYVTALRESLLKQADQLDLNQIEDSLSRSVILEVTGEMKLHGLQTPIQQTSSAPREATDPLQRQVSILQSGDLAQIRGILNDPKAIVPELVSHVIRLVARDDICREALKALNRIAHRIIGQLNAILLNPDEEFTVRRRLPLAYRGCTDPHAIDALVTGLSDKRFEVRFHCSRVLSRIHRKHSDCEMDSQRIQQALIHEVNVEKNVWDSRQLLDDFRDISESLFVDELLQDKARPSLEHIFALLSLAADIQPLTVAFRGLHTTDEMLRGTAIEFLSVTLPQDIGTKLLVFLEAPTEKPSSMSREEVAKKLICSSASIEMNLSALKRQTG